MSLKVRLILLVKYFAKGFRFITLEDEFGFINVIVRPQIYETYRRIIWSEQRHCQVIDKWD
ncbi:MAG: hypothetical protein AAFV93_15440 [Chloroflexota bacterium]